MKKIYMIMSALCLLTACNLDQFPPSEVAADAYIKDDASLNNVVVGMYNGMYGVLYSEWAVTELRTDNVRSRAAASTASDTKLIEQLDQATILTSNEYVQSYWDACYNTINRANTVLANLDKCKSEESRAQFEGEARFIRSLVYFNLVRLWGPVFIVTGKTGSDVARSMQRSPVEDVMALIISDLNSVIDDRLLPEKMPDAALGRAELDAAKFLLAKVYLTVYKAGSKEYSKGISLLEEVLDGRETGTLVPYDRIFATDNELNAEIIFAIRYKSGNLGVGAPFSSLYGPINNANSVVVGSPKHYNYPSDDLIAAFPEGDVRKNVTLRESYVNVTTGEEVTGSTARFCNKFIDYGMAVAYDADTDFPVMRLADVMLLYAEAVNETGGPEQPALDMLNAVRRRSGLPPYDLSQLNSRYAMREAIRLERRLEFAMENQRWYDLLRWGIAESTVNSFLQTEAFYGGYGYVVKSIESWQLLLPIPTSVIDINKSVAQNPGY